MENLPRFADDEIYDEEGVEVGIKKLLLNLLFRGIKDCFDPKQGRRREARLWMAGKSLDPDNPPLISYKLCKEGLNLGEGTIKAIEELVNLEEIPESFHRLSNF